MTHLSLGDTYRCAASGSILIHSDYVQMFRPIAHEISSIARNSDHLGINLKKRMASPDSANP